MTNLNSKTEIDLIGVQIDFGAAQKGVAMGPLAIRYAGLKDDLRSMGYTLRDKGDIVPPEDGMSLRHMIRFEQVNATNKQLYEEVSETLENGRFPLVLGGDHSIAAGSVSAVAKHYEPQGEIGVIWIDAHGDWNSDESTISGNMHGMPFSAVCGWGPDSMVDFEQKPHFVPTKHCVQVAGHDFDVAEAARMKEAGMNVFTISAIDKRGMSEVMKEAIRIAGDGTALHTLQIGNQVVEHGIERSGSQLHLLVVIGVGLRGVRHVAEGANQIEIAQSTQSRHLSQRGIQLTRAVGRIALSHLRCILDDCIATLWI